MDYEYIQNPRHHAYIIFGDLPKDLRSKEQEGLYVIQIERDMSVDNVRQLNEYASQTTDSLRRIVISTPSITFQAQNALLKVFEETHQGVCFFIHLPPGVRIIDTLASRCFIIEKFSI